MKAIGHKESGLSRPAFRPDVQGLRALAVVIVVLYHAGLSFEGGFVGVDVFFVLSGFVIMRGLHHELASTGGINLVAFAQRRIRRLLPAFALLLALVLPIGVLLSPIDGFSQAVSTAFAAVLFNANTFFHLSGDGYFSASAELNPLLHTWSLSVEEQFYFVFPAGVLLSWRLGQRLSKFGSARTLVVVLSAVGVLSLIVAEILASSTLSYSFSAPWGRVIIDERVAFFSMPTRAWEFAAGALVSFASPAKSERAGSVASAAGLGIVGACCFLYTSSGTVFPGLAAVVPVAATVALLWAGGSGPIGRLLASTPLQRIGNLSYGWYLWHWPLIVYARALTAGTRLDSPWFVGLVAVFAIVPAQLSMNLIENPVRRAEHMSSFRIVRLGAVCAALPLLVAAASGAAWSAIHSDTIESYEAQFAIHLDAANGCDSNFSAVDSGGGVCEFEVTAPLGSVALIGDSNAGHLSEGLRAAATDANYDLTIATRSSCLFADVGTAVGGHELRACAEAISLTTDRIVQTGVEMVVIGHAADTYISDPVFAVIDERTGEPVTSEAEKRQMIAAGLGHTVAQFVDAGIEVIVVQPVPRITGWEPGACAITRWAGNTTGCTGEASGEDLLAQRESMALINESVIASGGRVLDLSGAICLASGCEVFVDGSYLYRDEAHLSIAGSELLTDPLVEVLRGSDTSPENLLLFSD